MQLQNKRILITGSRRGIGRAIALEVARQGAQTLVHGQQDCPELAATLDEVRNFHAGAQAFFADLTRPADIDEMMGSVRAAAGGLDVLINNAATQHAAPLLDMTREDWDEVQAVNLRAPFLLSQHAARMMKEQGGGKIINISSVHAYQPRRNHAQYSCAKAGLEQLTKSLALELGQYNIQCNSVVLGAIATDLTSDERRQAFSTAIPMQRVGTVEEAARLVAFLCSNVCDYLNGSSITMDGGLTLGFCASRQDL